MAIRSNVGNVVTNATQILSIGATTASKVFRDRADSALNNKSKSQTSMQKPEYTEEEQSMITEAKKKKTLDSARKTLELGDKTKDVSPEYTEEEATTIKEAKRKKALDSARKTLEEDVVNSVEELNIPETTEGKEVRTNISENIFWLESRKQQPKSLEEEIKELKEVGGL